MKVGVFGGTFDPVHWGHLVLAEEARNAVPLDLVLFVPSGRPPHKSGRPLTPLAHRLAMVRLAIEQAPGFAMSTVESEGDGPHYTIDTLDRLAKERPGDEISFILGSDSLLELGSWHRPGDLVDRYPLVVLARPGFAARDADPRFTGRMTLVDSVSVAVSSTLLRSRLRAGSPVTFLVPDRVLAYAREHHLYAPGTES